MPANLKEKTPCGLDEPIRGAVCRRILCELTVHFGLLGVQQLNERAAHVVHKGRADAVGGVAGVGRVFGQRQMVLKAGVAGVDGLVAAMGAGTGLGGDFLTAFGAGLEHR